MRKVLIIKLGALGDVLLATPHIERIWEAHKGEAVWLLTAPQFGGLFENHPGISVQTFPRKGVRAMLSLLFWLVRMRFDVVYDLQGSERSGVMSVVSMARKRIGMGYRWPYNRHVSIKEYSDEHIFDRLNRVLVMGGLSPAGPRPTLYPAKEDKRKVERWMAEHGLEKGGFVVCHAGSSGRWASKRWPFYGQLGEMLERRGVRVVWIGAAEDQNINSSLAKRLGIDATGIFSIFELSLLAQNARFALVNDSGPMHILSTANKPVYAFFGPTDWRRHHAIGQRERVFVGKADCAPCYLGSCPRSPDRACLRSIEPEQVMERLLAEGML